ncbi:MAG TPA: L-2-hydroxyglutarate oxidase [Acidobacteriota bacterium]|nr:L-2-hydroxyglutarate oxidase [Acidobacteriota bacterium]
MSAATHDIAIVGGGIVGLGTALALLECYPRYSVVVLEKEQELAAHQTGHNSGVIHAGIYYKPGSYKAKLCVSGVRLLTKFCEANGIPYERCGKLIVATSESEIPRLQLLYDRGKANGVPGLEIVSPERAREIEPHARAIRALHSPSTAIVDFKQVAEKMGVRIVALGGRILKGTQVRTIRRTEGDLWLETNGDTIHSRNLINCAGLHSDSVARLMGLRPDLQIIPFRGEYYTLRPGCGLVCGLIYPVPDPEFPFLGVHFTKRIHGDYEAGPNAVLAFARQGYHFTQVRPADLFEMFTFSGFWAMAAKYWRVEAYELYRSLSRGAFLRALQKLVPDLEDSDLAPGGSGVRAQAVAGNGRLVDDFQILEAPNAIHVLNAPSPAATASIAIGRHIAGLASASFGLNS